MLDYIAFGVMLGCCVIQAIDIGVYSAQKNYKGWRLCVIALVCTAGATGALFYNIIHCSRGWNLFHLLAIVQGAKR